MTDFVRVKHHRDRYYNDIYYRCEEWNDYSHFCTEDRSAHFYVYDGDNTWALDFRE